MNHVSVDPVKNINVVVGLYKKIDNVEIINVAIIAKSTDHS